MLMFIVDRLLRPYGYGWVALVVGAVAFVLLGWLSWRQRDPLDRKIGAWLSQGLLPQTRAAAISEAREMLRRFEGARSRFALSRAHRVRLALAELLSANGELSQAQEVLSEAPQSALKLDEQFSLRLAEATAALRAHDRDLARSALAKLPPSAAALLSAQKDLLEIALLLEQDEPSRALEEVNRCRPRCAAFPSLRLQLRLYHAAALQLLGQKSEAKEIVDGLDETARSSARVYGLPPVRILLGDGEPGTEQTG